MATTPGGEADAVGNDFPTPLVGGKLEQHTNTDFPAKKEKPRAEDEEKKEWMENFKSTLMVSGVVIAVIGAVIAVVKKIKEA